MFPALDLYYTDPARRLRTAAYDRADLHRDLSDLSDLYDVWTTVMSTVISTVISTGISTVLSSAQDELFCPEV